MPDKIADSPTIQPKTKAMWKSSWLRWLGIFVLIVLAIFFGIRGSKQINWNTNRSIAQPMDSLDGVVVYYNGGVGQSHGRNTAPDGYNIGIRYQCVEFVKRYYLEVYHHKMPDSYGHAKDFFDPNVQDGELNPARGLRQFKNGGRDVPQHGDLLIWGPSMWNPYGHVAIVIQYKNSPKADLNSVQYIQQNPGPFGNARESVKCIRQKDGYRLDDKRILGWLRVN